VARKLRGFERVLDAPRLFAVAYGEIASSLYFALGIVAGQALGLTPAVLLATGALFLVVALSYAEAVSALPETGGTVNVVRRASNDLAGFVAGWALLLDYLIVISLSALFLPHYLGGALGIEELRESPWDVIGAVAVIAGLAVARLVKRTQLHTGAVAIAGLDLGVQLLLVVLGLAFVVTPDALDAGLGVSEGLELSELAFALPLAMLAYTGLETVANLAEETREPGRAVPRSLFSAIGLVVLVTALIAVVGLAAYPPADGRTALGDQWLEAPLLGIAAAFDGTPLPGALADAIRIAVGLSGVLVLLAAATTSVSGCTRLAHSMGEHGMLPRELGRLERRTLVSAEAIVAISLVAIAIVVGNAVLTDDDPVGLASVYSFGVLLAFTAAQLAVLALRVREPELPRPFRARPELRVRGVPLPLPALIGAPLTFAVFVLAVVTHPGARYAGPAWLAAGLAVFLVVRLGGGRGLLEEIEPVEQLPPGAEFRRILVPMKLGDIGEEMVATAIAIAMERGAAVEALYVVPVPRELPLDAALPPEVEERAHASLEEARLLGEDHDVVVAGETVRARSIGHAIVEEARNRNADLVVLGSSPRWRREARFFSPTVDHVLRHAPCEVLVVAFPQGTFDGE
jgi:basic amino acid/polyamine antiporter, APA family